MKKAHENELRSNAGDAIGALRSEAALLLEISDKNAQPVARILRLLKVIDDALTLSTEQPEHCVNQKNSASRTFRSYEVEVRNGQEVLVEHWPGKPLDAFRCSRDTYDAAATVIEEGRDSGVHFTELLGRIGKKQGHMPSEHHVRMCVRFWLGENLLLRSKYLYSPKMKPDFAKAAARAWIALTAKARIQPE